MYIPFPKVLYRNEGEILVVESDQQTQKAITEGWSVHPINRRPKVEAIESVKVRAISPETVKVINQEAPIVEVLETLGQINETTTPKRGPGRPRKDWA